MLLVLRLALPVWLMLPVLLMLLMLLMLQASLALQVLQNGPGLRPRAPMRLLQVSVLQAVAVGFAPRPRCWRPKGWFPGPGR